ncbi:MAG: alpha-galactosidase [Clostridia bacterium]|nr:alpha-galactosidase [Clostridia bacterium]
MNFEIKGFDGAKITLENEKTVNGVRFFDVHMVLDEEKIPETVTIRFSVPDADIYSIWSPALRYDRRLGVNWGKKGVASRLCSWMPLHALVSQNGRNRMTVALSDAKTPTALRAGICEENANFEWDIQFFTEKVAPLKEYCATVRIDTRDIPYYDSIYDVASWWENECGYKPAYVPEHARLPMNSLWYSYHQQLDVEDIVKECQLSKPLGMDTVIIDDGWQTDDNNRGYAYCGDWRVATKKIPDMKEFVDRIHETGMKVMLWYSVPFVGLYSENYKRFETMLLDQSGNRRDHFALDPRYKEVRDFLIDIYSRALLDWGLDGLKLDFIDSFVLRGKSLEYDERRDYQSLEDAVDVLMTDINSALRAINPEVLIEFRQSYVGPAIRKYGNMFRVGDCPNDAIRNRQDVVALRLTSGNTAVHSDMLMWHRDDPVESAALQIVSALYSVPQISVKIATLPEDHKKMLAHYLSFWRAHRDILIDGKLLAANPECANSIVCAEKDGKAIFTAYTDTIIDCRAYSEVIAVNSSRHRALVLKGAAGKSYRVVDCMGNAVSEGKVDGALCEIAVPLSGMIFVND